MKKQFSKLTKTEQERIEWEYHRMKPADFDEQMARAERHSPETIRLPEHLIIVLKAIAELEGEAHYQAMIRKWIEERLQQEARLVMKYSKLPLSELAAILNRQALDKAPA